MLLLPRAAACPALLRTRAGYLGLGAITMGLGLASRHYATALPTWVGAYAGDALWALLVYWLVGALQPGWAVHYRALAAGIFATSIEISQLWQAPWLQALRHTTLGPLVLGQGFLWSDLACYAVGIAVGAGLEKRRVGLPAKPRRTPLPSTFRG